MTDDGVDHPRKRRKPTLFSRLTKRRRKWLNIHELHAPLARVQPDVLASVFLSLHLVSFSLFMFIAVVFPLCARPLNHAPRMSPIYFDKIGTFKRCDCFTSHGALSPSRLPRFPIAQSVSNIELLLPDIDGYAIPAQSRHNTHCAYRVPCSHRHAFAFIFNINVSFIVFNLINGVYRNNWPHICFVRSSHRCRRRQWTVAARHSENGEWDWNENP